MNLKKNKKQETNFQEKKQKQTYLLKNNRNQLHEVTYKIKETL